jgi:lia operon protein LiaG
MAGQIPGLPGTIKKLKTTIMKTIKIVLITLITFLGAGRLTAQEYKIAVQNTKDSKLILKDFSGDLPIEGYSGNEIIFTSANESFAPPEKAKGLKPIYPGGTDNSGLGLSVQKNGNQITVTCLLPFTRRGEYKIKVPDNLALEMSSGCERSSDISVSGMKNELDIENCHDIVLKNVSGPLVLSTIAGEINITFGTMVTDKPFSINSVSGDIDITLPAKTATNIEMGTINGGFYSDFDISDTQKDMKRVGGNHLSAALNGGGFKFSIETVNGNIYLRKGN